MDDPHLRDLDERVSTALGQLGLGISSPLEVQSLIMEAVHDYTDQRIADSVEETRTANRKIPDIVAEDARLRSDDPADIRPSEHYTIRLRPVGVQDGELQFRWEVWRILVTGPDRIRSSLAASGTEATGAAAKVAAETLASALLNPANSLDYIYSSCMAFRAEGQWPDVMTPPNHDDR